MTEIINQTGQSISALFERAREEITEISPAQAEVAVESGALLIDVREDDEWAGGHAEGALHLPKSYLETRIEALVPDRGRQLVLYCASGKRSLLAAKTLFEDLGYKRVSSLAGGIAAWREAGLAISEPIKLSEAERERYTRHLVLEGVGLEGQAKLRAASVLVLGAGGLGSPALMYLAAAGIGRIGIVDDDVVEVSNLQRQIVHTTARAGVGKAESAASALQALNPEIEVFEYPVRLGPENVLELIKGYDVILDGTDNFPTRYLLNDAAFREGIPVVSASILSFDGQLSVFAPMEPWNGPCYRCLYPEPPPAELAPSCGEAGVLGAMAGTMGVLQALEAIKLILGIGEPLVGRMLVFDSLEPSFRILRSGRDPECPVCSKDPNELAREDLGIFPDYEAFCAR